MKKVEAGLLEGSIGVSGRLKTRLRLRQQLKVQGHNFAVATLASKLWGQASEDVKNWISEVKVEDSGCWCRSIACNPKP